MKKLGKEDSWNLKIKQSTSMHSDKRSLLATTGMLDSIRKILANKKSNSIIRLYMIIMAGL
jgi:hypothetical protein